MHLDEYCKFLRLKMVKADSVTRKRRFLELWFEELKIPPSVTPFEIHAQLLKLCTNLGVPEKGFNDRLSHLNGYYNFLIGMRYFDGANPCMMVPRKKVPRHIRGKLEDADIIKLINCPRLPNSPQQDHETYSLMIKCYAALGCRRSDLLNLKLTDLHVGETAYVIFRNTKSGNDAQLPLPQKLARDILTNARKYSFKTFAFENRYGRQVSPDGIEQAFRRRLIFLGIITEQDKGINTHALRHSRASRLDENHTDLSLTSRLLYHEEVSTTMRYIHSSNTRMQEGARNDPIFKMLD